MGTFPRWRLRAGKLSLKGSSLDILAALATLPGHICTWRYTIMVTLVLEGKISRNWLGRSILENDVISEVIFEIEISRLKKSRHRNKSPMAAL